MLLLLEHGIDNGLGVVGVVAILCDVTEAGAAGETGAVVEGAEAAWCCPCDDDLLRDPVLDNLEEIDEKRDDFLTGGEEDNGVAAGEVAIFDADEEDLDLLADVPIGADVGVTGIVVDPGKAEG
ncbi:unnamed protein product [[Candida] boidinii]|nr:unnamed protein product [[Candida] boidinii]